MGQLDESLLEKRMKISEMITFGHIPIDTVTVTFPTNDMNSIEIENPKPYVIGNDIILEIKRKSKRQKKTFKKYLMSKGYSRDTAEHICDIVKIFQGNISYYSLWIYFWLGGTIPEDSQVYPIKV